ncbi:hypothetical protein MRX96_038559 [Rhipicephalus microplus]
MAVNEHGSLTMCDRCRGSLSCQSILAAPHTNPPDASSVQPAVALDAAGAATFHAPTVPLELWGFRLGNSNTHVSPVIHVVVPVLRQ